MSIRQLSQELQLKANLELNESPERIHEDITNIKIWLKKRRDISCRMENQWLLTLLRCCKFSLERAKEKLEMFYEVRTAIPEFFGDRDPFAEDIQTVLKIGICVPLANTADGQPRVVVYRPGFDYHQRLTADSIFKCNLMINEIALNEDDQMVIAGVIMLCDLQGMNVKNIRIYNPSIVQKAMTCFHTVYPQRIKTIHFFNFSKAVAIPFGVFTALLKEKIKNRIVIHYGSDVNKLHAALPKSILPTEYGGDGGRIQEHVDYWKEKVESYRDWFKEDSEKYGIDESKKLKAVQQISSDFFGMPGSFRKLNID